MIHITLQRNDTKTQSDKVWHDKDSITLNGRPYQFPQGKNIAFESPHDQIFDAYRDADGILYATVLKQYAQADQGLFEGSGDIAPDNPEATPLKPIAARIADPKHPHKTVSELLFEKKAALQAIRQQIIEQKFSRDAYIGGRYGATLWGQLNKNMLGLSLGLDHTRMIGLGMYGKVHYSFLFGK